MVGGNEDNGNLVQKAPCRHCCIQCPPPYSRPLPTHTSAGDSWTLAGKSGSVSCGVPAPFSWVLVHTRSLFVPSKSLFPQSCVSSGGSMMVLMATSSKRAYAIPRSTAPRAPAPCSSLLLTHISAGDTQTPFCLSLCGVSGSWCAQGLFETSENLKWVWGLILNTISPLLPSFWGFSALGHGVSPQSHSSTTQLPLQLVMNIPKKKTLHMDITRWSILKSD